MPSFEVLLDEENAPFRIIAEASSKAHVFIRCKTAEEGDIELSLGLQEQASLFVLLSIEAGSAPLRLKQTALLAARSRLHLFCVTQGSSVEQSVTSFLDGDHARSDIDWVFSASQSDVQRLSVKNVFRARDGSGEMTVKGVAQDRAFAKVDGFIEIAPGGGGTETYLTEDVLMLDPGAKIDAIPGLQIETNDVKASHSATVSRISPEDLFYFASRGIAEGEARQILLEGFLRSLLERIPREDWRVDIERKLMDQGSPASL